MGDIEESMEIKKYYLYYYLNLLDFTLYVGKGCGRRVKWHLYNYKPSLTHKQSDLHKAIEKDGLEHFKYAIFAYYDGEGEAYREEARWEKQLREMGWKLYNKKEGGTGGFAELHTKVPEKVQQAICEYFNEIKIVDRVVEKFDYAPCTIRRTLARNGIEEVDNWRDLVNKVKKKDHKEICRLYVEEEKTATEISKIYGSCLMTISKVLSDNGVYTKTTSQRFTPNKEKEIYEKYCELQNRSKVAKLFDCSDVCVRNIVNEHKDERLDEIYKQNIVYEQEICNAYKNNITATTGSIAKQYNCSPKKIISILSRHNVFIKKSTRPQELNRQRTNKYDNNVELEIYTKYQELKSYAAVARLYHEDETIIRGVVLRCKNALLQLSEHKDNDDK